MANILDALHQTFRAGIYSPQEYAGSGTIFRRSPRVARALSVSQTSQKSLRVAALFEQMIAQGETLPNLRWAAYWLLQNGVTYFKFSDPYMTQKEVEEQAETIQSFYINILSILKDTYRPDKDRIFALQMLMNLGAIEHLGNLKKIIATGLKAKQYDELLMRTVKTYFDLVEDLDLEIADQQNFTKRLPGC